MSLIVATQQKFDANNIADRALDRIRNMQLPNESVKLKNVAIPAKRLTISTDNIFTYGLNLLPMLEIKIKMNIDINFSINVINVLNIDIYFDIIEIHVLNIDINYDI